VLSFARRLTITHDSQDSQILRSLKESQGEHPPQKRGVCSGVARMLSQKPVQGNSTANGHDDGTPERRKTATTRPARTWDTLHDGKERNRTG